MEGIANQNEEFKNALLGIDRLKASEIFSQNFCKTGNFEMLENMVIVSLEKIGEGWEQGRYSLA